MIEVTGTLAGLVKDLDTAIAALKKINAKAGDLDGVPNHLALIACVALDDICGGDWDQSN